MTHRRAFLRHVAGVAGAVGAGSLPALDRLWAEPVQAASRRPAQLADEYQLGPGVSYLNHGSIGTIPRVVSEAHAAYLALCETNPHLYMWGAWTESVEAVRAKAAALLNCEADELAITHNTTEGFNTLAQGLPLGHGDEVLFSSLNHAGASLCWDHTAAARGFTVRRFEIPLERLPDATPREVVEWHEQAIGPATRVLVLPHIDNIVGLRHPMKEIAAAARVRGVEFVAVDGAQALGMLPTDLHDAGIDFYAASPHKWVQAPKGLGVLFVRRERLETLRPMWVTWGQQRWAGSARVYEDYGTRNLPAVLALGDALDFQASLGEAWKTGRYRTSWESWREATDRAPFTTWRSPRSWQLSASLFALDIAGMPSAAFANRMYVEHGFVMRAFQMTGLNAVRISPNVANTDEEMARFFAVGERLAG